MDIERELRSALRRKSAPDGFAMRVMQRLQPSPGASRHPLPQAGEGTKHWRAVAAAVLFTVLLGGWTAHTIVQRREGQRAREELLLALRITSAKLHEAQSHVVK